VPKGQVPEHCRLLIAARKRAGLTGRQVADKMGVSESAYRNAENGRFGRVVFENVGKVFPPEVAGEIHGAWAAWSQSSTPEQFAGLTHSRDGVLVPIELLQGLAEARVTRFHPSRKYYKLLREGRSTISGYVGQATTSLEMVSIALATGMELERVVDTFEELVRKRPPVSITVSLLDPELEYLMSAIAGVIGASGSTLAGRIRDTVSTLKDFRDQRLSRNVRDRFEVWAHASLPNASAIIIDGDLDTGLVQLETKGYKLGMEKSFGFEASAPSEFFRDLRDSYRHLIRDGRRIL
jgi:hypothetical protein